MLTLVAVAVWQGLQPQGRRLSLARCGWQRCRTRLVMVHEVSRPRQHSSHHGKPPVPGELQQHRMLAR